MDNKTYRPATREEFDDINYAPFDKLIGPNGFECLLTEPEDRNWYRDGSDVIDELNRLYEENKELHKRLAQAAKYLPNE